MKYPKIREFLEDHSEETLKKYIGLRKDLHSEHSSKEYTNEVWSIIEELAGEENNYVPEYIYNRDADYDEDVETRESFNDFVEKIAVAHVAQLMLEEKKESEFINVKVTDKDDGVLSIFRNSIKDWSYNDRFRSVFAELHIYRTDGDDPLTIMLSTECIEYLKLRTAKDNTYIAKSSEFERLHDWLKENA